MTTLRQTPSQTAGPYLHIGCAPVASGVRPGAGDLGAAAFPDDAPGEVVQVGGLILDGAGEAVTDAMVEVWQADAAGRFGGASGHAGWARRMVDPTTGEWRLRTIRPAALPAQAPHLMLWIAARGLNCALHTRLYFADDDHSGDPVLAAAGARAATMIARPDWDIHRLDIHLQGEGETVFLAV
ncbi:protocatechuate 3,4-dioxygenase subunit alpha [Jannaschia sp. S6380]|uniref:protocatechuate 3,4-dioxygenase subunit alpha n=1 Tax=Jannaschia sp. S6380 TaxID=2926408 RepID=UPI001FF2854C|nr:protocatechuate 3,4-dioxygenase subunit alpha [Jannaschia sp. S6380]MCK0166272.1 protocatechuate 3,4-dioxygenase subunit alpha [Jannaschia sp. S6380]